jgi:hypothetical protein
VTTNCIVTTKKLILDNSLNSSKLSIVAAKIVRIMSQYTINASDSHTVLHPLWSIDDKLIQTKVQSTKYTYTDIIVTYEIVPITLGFFNALETQLVLSRYHCYRAARVGWGVGESPL